MEKSKWTWIILAGGKSRRMGTAKQDLPWKHGSMLDAAVEKGSFAGADEILVSTNAPDGRYRCIPDRIPDAGPLAGIHACLLAAENDICMVVPVDVPMLPMELAQQMVRAARNADVDYLPLYWNGKQEPLVAVFRRNAAWAIEQMLKRRECAVRGLTQSVRWKPFEAEGDPQMLENCNTPEVYRQMWDRYGKE